MRQLLKIIKFTNVLIPKMGLMTAVLGKGFADLAFFGIVFIISMMASPNPSPSPDPSPSPSPNPSPSP